MIRASFLACSAISAQVAGRLITHAILAEYYISSHSIYGNYLYTKLSVSDLAHLAARLMNLLPASFSPASGVGHPD